MGFAGMITKCLSGVVFILFYWSTWLQMRSREADTEFIRACSQKSLKSGICFFKIRYCSKQVRWPQLAVFLFFNENSRNLFVNLCHSLPWSPPLLFSLTPPLFWRSEKKKGMKAFCYLLSATDISGITSTFLTFIVVVRSWSLLKHREYYWCPKWSSGLSFAESATDHMWHFNELSETYSNESEHNTKEQCIWVYVFRKDYTWNSTIRRIWLETLLKSTIYLWNVIPISLWSLSKPFSKRLVSEPGGDQRGHEARSNLTDKEGGLARERDNRERILPNWEKVQEGMRLLFFTLS